MELRVSDRRRCAVCGFSEVRVDEVVDRGPVTLAECPRCESRWTSTLPPALAVRATAGAVVRRVAHGTQEIAPAA